MAVHGTMATAMAARAAPSEGRLRSSSQCGRAAAEGAERWSDGCGGAWRRRPRGEATAGPRLR
uniref:Uncharacterized protein n=1 Tax=Arundo donax TaxID=35708 RepID=A0A0A8YSU7_ARUDO